MRIWLPLVAAAVLGAAAAAGASLLIRHSHPWAENLHEVIHRRIKLTAAEQARLKTAEAAYLARRAMIEADIRAANGRLAKAIEIDPEMSPEVMAASDQVERSAAELQRATLQHVFEIRAALDPSHRAAYDAVLVDVLSRGR